MSGTRTCPLCGTQRWACDGKLVVDNLPDLEVRIYGLTVGEIGHLISWAQSRRDWVTKDKWERCQKRKDIFVEDNDPYKAERNKRIEELKSLIKTNVVARHDFDLEGHLWALCHAVR